MKQTIYRYHSRISVFTGTEEECWQWVVNQAQTINSKREKFVRIFQEKDRKTQNKKKIEVGKKIKKKKKKSVDNKNYQ